MGLKKYEKKGPKKDANRGQEEGNGKKRIDVPPWRCVVCDLLPEPFLRRVEVAWLSGQLTVERRNALAKMLTKRGVHNPSFAHEAVQRHLDVCLFNRNRSRYARTAEQFNLLWDALRTAHNVYQSNPDMFNATAYAGFVKQLRGLLQDLDKIQNAAELSEEITGLALNPLVRNLTNVIISESGRLKEELLGRIPEHDVERIMSSFIERSGVEFKRAAETAYASLLDVLAARDHNRASAVRGHPKKKRSTGKKTPLRLVK